MKKDCWCNKNGKNSKDTASLENPGTLEDSSTTEPPITGMLMQPDSDELLPIDLTKWMYSVTRHAHGDNDFLIDSGAATSVRQEKLANSLGGTPTRRGVELRSATGHQFTTTGKTTMCLRT